MAVEALQNEDISGGKEYRRRKGAILQSAKEERIGGA